MAKRPYLDDLQTARLWAKVKALVSPLSSRVTTLEGQVQTNTTDLSGLATRVRTLELKYDTNVTGNSWSVASPASPAWWSLVCGMKAKGGLSFKCPTMTSYRLPLICWTTPSSGSRSKSPNTPRSRPM